ncbi:trypsin-like peptidase domain-containing protein [Georgenia sp. MJ173]|uniref:trypsin-like peptidase domain-containing protein n=1 Tax=Georgenia sunbinii TaxID=3117728 RepID=UPI002F26C41D
MTRRRLLVPGLAAAALGATMLAGCGVVPPMPGPMPADHVPDVEAPHVGDPGALSPDGVDAAERMAVRIRNVGCGKLSTGSGFALDERTIVTNRHVVADTDRIQVTTYDGLEIDAVSVGVTDVADLALLRTSEPVTTVPGLAEVDAAVGDEITVVGYPQGGQLTTTTGTVLGYEQDPIGSDLGVVGRTNAQVDHGSSGSAVLGVDGQVVGVVYAMDVWNNSYVVPVSTLHDLLTEDAFEPLGSCRDSESTDSSD